MFGWYLLDQNSSPGETLTTDMDSPPIPESVTIGDKTVSLIGTWDIAVLICDLEISPLGGATIRMIYDYVIFPGEIEIVE